MIASLNVPDMKISYFLFSEDRSVGLVVTVLPDFT